MVICSSLTLQGLCWWPCLQQNPLPLQAAAVATGHPLTLHVQACAVSLSCTQSSLGELHPAGSVALSLSSMCTLLYLPFFPVDSSHGPFLCPRCCTAAVCIQRRMLELGLNVNHLKVSLRKHRVQITGCESPDGKRRILSPWCTAESAVLQPCFLSQSLLDKYQTDSFFH